MTSELRSVKRGAGQATIYNPKNRRLLSIDEMPIQSLAKSKLGAISNNQNTFTGPNNHHNQAQASYRVSFYQNAN